MNAGFIHAPEAAPAYRTTEMSLELSPSAALEESVQSRRGAEVVGGAEVESLVGAVREIKHLHDKAFASLAVLEICRPTALSMDKRQIMYLMTIINH